MGKILSFVFCEFQVLKVQKELSFNFLSSLAQNPKLNSTLKVDYGFWVSRKNSLNYFINVQKDIFFWTHVFDMRFWILIFFFLIWNSFGTFFQIWDSKSCVLDFTVLPIPDLNITTTPGASF